MVILSWHHVVTEVVTVIISNVSETASVGYLFLVNLAAKISLSNLGLNLK